MGFKLDACIRLSHRLTELYHPRTNDRLLRDDKYAYLVIMGSIKEQITVNPERLLSFI